ncbi:uncharacterized protein LOC122880942 [Siniperca chuatsi]|uniref:uncharacterized protein LOC122880942 n=1 Tax=Siniperca chuatsi TaxID=119488 RepID=UPI001CE169A5|nr:uncharacterized protein LOC122880942 [Siniperca chuatsi]XP_044062410.1 uncharacterized protein LOC122880942 [Siniperca chuatsi]XP_044062411.1 uncharacterized protein LOC122880942 [Siniperca chuatsi]XP_044062412.1 uncharacterized protein LOC122880942 [Siniperca chuatsi]XP_044062413.1 uncharacterized protein LOC122880942 [Siniperca chuatsi]XP_044062414.1 uncharacterized protein LOC122880942 [Siniperca chuatsi]XP_044062415.1 uncharacterized protein LOC122880942 [Siniperca chuatsi]XP_04406241
MVGKFVGGKLGDVRSVRITGSGMIIIECVSKRQRERALKIHAFGDHSSVNCFPLGAEIRKKGVVSGVPLTVEAEFFQEVEDVCEAKWLTRFRNGEEEDSNSVCLTFEGELPERVDVDYVCYRARPYERAPLRSFCCQEYGHVAAGCRGGRRCGRCGKDNCNVEECKVEKEQAKCLHCEGNHHTGPAQCPKRIKEVKMNKIRAEKGSSYAEAAKSKMVVVQKEKEQKGNGDNQSISVDKKRFLAFIAMVINCAAEIKGKSERIKMVLDAARRFLNVVDTSGEDLDVTLREGVAPTQTMGSGI